MAPNGVSPSTSKRVSCVFFVMIWAWRAYAQTQPGLFSLPAFSPSALSPLQTLSPPFALASTSSPQLWQELAFLPRISLPLCLVWSAGFLPVSFERLSRHQIQHQSTYPHRRANRSADYSPCGTTPKSALNRAFIIARQHRFLVVVVNHDSPLCI